MDPLFFELLGGLLVGGMVWLTVFHRPRHSVPQTMPVLAVRRTRSSYTTSRQKPIPATKAKNKVATPKLKRRLKTKVVAPTAESIQAPTQPISGPTTLNTCPSCGLQAPETLLAEHFISSPSHKDGIQKIPATVAEKVEQEGKTGEDDSKQSVRNLLQILVPPRAFGLRHAHRSASPISPLVHELEPHRRHFP